MIPKPLNNRHMFHKLYGNVSVKVYREEHVKAALQWYKKQLTKPRDQDNTVHQEFRRDEHAICYEYWLIDKAFEDLYK